MVSTRVAIGKLIHALEVWSDDPRLPNIEPLQHEPSTADSTAIKGGAAFLRQARALKKSKIRGLRAAPKKASWVHFSQDTILHSERASHKCKNRKWPSDAFFAFTGPSQFLSPKFPLPRAERRAATLAQLAAGRLNTVEMTAD